MLKKEVFSLYLQNEYNKALMKKSILLAIILTLHACQQTIKAQEKFTWEDFIEQAMLEDEENTEEDELTYEVLEHLHLHPINLNMATEEELLQLPFIDKKQAESIITYRDRNKPMRSTGELMFINELDKRTRDYLQLFCFAGETEENNRRTTGALLKNIKHETAMKFDAPLYTKEGQRRHTAEELQKSPNKEYRGDRFHENLRYTLSSQDKLFAGIILEKDAGEKGVDYVSGYIMAKGIDLGRKTELSNVIAGNYRISLGQGLAINTATSFGKSMSTNLLNKMDRGISPHRSGMEYGYLTGGAASIKLSNITLSAFAGYTRRDGTMRNDYAGVSAIKTDGLHRTPLEYSKKGNMTETTFGGNLHWEHNRLKLSFTAVNTHFSMPLAPSWDTDGTLYKKYNAQGRDFQVYSLSYQLRLKRVTITGESAMSHTEGLKEGHGRQNGFATIATITYTPNSTNRFMLTGRSLGAKFVSIHGKTFSENSLPQNERGVYLGWRTSMIPSIDIDAYVDVMYFPWLKSGVSKASYGIDSKTQITYTHNRISTWELRYSIKSKQKDYKTVDQQRVLQFNTRHSIKLQNNLNITKSLALRSSAYLTLCKFAINPVEKGYAICEDLRWEAKKLKTSVGLAYFDTDSYNTRVYTYESSPLYSFGMTSLMYRGIRAYAMMSYSITGKLIITGKIGMTKYLNRDEISSGTELIRANHKEDVQMMLRWKI